MTAKYMTIGILSKEAFIERTMSIVKGEYKPKKTEPKIWFDSIKSLAEVLSEQNQKLLELISINNPESLSELEKLSGRSKSNLSRTLKTLERYGIVELNKVDGKLITTVNATKFKVEFGLDIYDSNKSASLNNRERPTKERKNELSKPKDSVKSAHRNTAAFA